MTIEQRGQRADDRGRSWRATSSAASGLRFCGMIEEPVVKRSDSLTKPNLRRRPEHDLLGKAGQMHGGEARRGERLQREVAVGDGVERVGRRPVEAERRRGDARSIGKEVPASAAAPSGHLVEPLARIGEAAAVARDHLDIGEEMMAESDRLRRSADA